MQLFLDCASLEEIKKAKETGLISGLTTNPALLSKTASVSVDLLKGLTASVDGPVSIQVLSQNADEMVLQGQQFADLAENVVVKVPMAAEGLKAAKALHAKKIATNVTLCFSPAQALLAAEAGATFVSPFMGRLDDAGESGAQLIEDIRTLYDIQGFETQILAASIRGPQHVEAAAIAGAEAATMSPKVFWQLFESPHTQKGLDDITPLYGDLQKKLL